MSIASISLELKGIIRQRTGLVCAGGNDGCDKHAREFDKIIADTVDAPVILPENIVRHIRIQAAK
jgi:hypothetical protein